MSILQICLQALQNDGDVRKLKINEGPCTYGNLKLRKNAEFLKIKTLETKLFMHY